MKTTIRPLTIIDADGKYCTSECEQAHVSKLECKQFRDMYGDNIILQSIEGDDGGGIILRCQDCLDAEVV